MTDLPTILPDFPTRPYTHLIPSLDRHGITVADLLSLDALEIAKRASLPILDLRRLAEDVVHTLQDDLGISVTAHTTSDEPFSSSRRNDSEWGWGAANDVVKHWDTISILDENLDKAIGGGIPAGYVTEFTGERLVDLMVSQSKVTDAV
jgi:DNA repair protein RAD57